MNPRERILSSRKTVTRTVLRECAGCVTGNSYIFAPSVDDTSTTLRSYDRLDRAMSSVCGE